MSVDLYQPCPLEPPVYINALRADHAALVQVAQTADLATPVTTCGEWTLRDLLRHVGFVHRWATEAIATTAAPDRSQIVMPDGDDATTIAGWFDEGGRRLFEALQAHDAHEATWHPFPPAQLHAVWIRRMAHETSVHRIDAELACGRAVAVDAVLASDGIDEYLSLTLPHLLAGKRAELPSGTLHLHCTDVAGEWLVEDDGGLRISREHAKGDAAVRGPAAAILADLWGRSGRLGDVDVVGDQTVAERWLSIGGN